MDRGCRDVPTARLAEITTGRGNGSAQPRGRSRFKGPTSDERRFVHRQDGAFGHHFIGMMPWGPQPGSRAEAANPRVFGHQHAAAAGTDVMMVVMGPGRAVRPMIALVRMLVGVIVAVPVAALLGRHAVGVKEADLRQHLDAESGEDAENESQGERAEHGGEQTGHGREIKRETGPRLIPLPRSAHAPPMPVAEPHKEIRFTRAAQAAPFWVLASVAAMAAVTLFCIGLYRPENPELPHSAWALLPLLLGAATARLALHCTRRAYLILSPLGIEIFPFFRPIRGMRMIPWGEIDAVEVGGRQLTLHFDAERKSGVHLDLSPVPKNRRPLLVKALQGRIEGKTTAGRWEAG